MKKLSNGDPSVDRSGLITLSHAGVTALNAIEPGRFYREGFHAGLWDPNVKLYRVAFTLNHKLTGYAEGYIDIDKTGGLRLQADDSPRRDDHFRCPVKIVSAFVTSRERLSMPHEVRAIFSEMEILRFYYANSNKLTKALFQGDFEPDRIHSKVVSIEDGEPYYDPVKGHHRLKYHKTFDEPDVPFIARIVFDPSGLAMAGARRVHRRMTLSAAQDPLGIGYPRTLFPFSGSVELEATGQFVHYRGEEMFLVQRIRSCNQPYPFKRLSAQSTATKKKTTATGPQGAHPFTPPPTTGPGARAGSMDSLAMANANSKPAHSQPDDRRFTVPFEVVFEDVPMSDEVAARAKRVSIDNELVHTSPGGTTSGNATAVQQLLVDRIVHGAPPKELAPFVAALVALRKASAVVSPPAESGRVNAVTTLSIGFEAWEDRSSPPPIVYCPLPRVETEGGGRYMSFSFKDKECTQRRHVVIAEVHTIYGWVYVMDSEVRTGRSGNVQTLGVLVAWAKGRTQVPTSVLQAFLYESVRKKSWDLSRFDDGSGTLKHEGDSVQTPLVERIERKFKRDLRPLAGASM